MQRKFIVLFIFFLSNFFSCTIFAANILSVSQGDAIEIDAPKGYDHVFVFSNLLDAEISYMGTASDVKWTRVSDNFTTSGVDYLSPDDATGYILKAGNDSTTFYVFDYSNYTPVLSALQVDETYDNSCENVFLKLVATIPTMRYFSLITNQLIVVNREFQLKYDSKKWDEQNLEWSDCEISTKVNGNFQEGLFEAPLCDTQFKLSGDQFAEQFGLPQQSIETARYAAVRVACNPTTITDVRDGENELDRPEESTIEGSAPLNVLFKANANEPIARYYAWNIVGSGTTLLKTDREFRYTFEEAGEYNVNLQVTNDANCLDTATIVVRVFDSLLDIPNVFTPNGDGVNDEFRVAYRSLIEFQAEVFNRWGRKVYEWTDPAKGWDGTINGRDASPGAYFYSIKARGADDKVYKLKGDINLIGR